ncbi:MAG: DUF4845 domain-containing protein [Betaproteobacteria bacterium]|nr:DUF4845 domain-containing protein [Betaproteobacteria bacterium]
MRGQKGLTLTGFIIGIIVLAMLALLGMKIGPPYLEYLTIKKQLQIIANDPEVATGQRRPIEVAFERRAMIEDMKSITSKDLQINKQGDTVTISAEYSVCVPLVANIRACMDFYPTSAK